MTNAIFNVLTKQRFGFLVSIYGFAIVEETEVSENPLWRGRILYHSPYRRVNSKERQTGVQITLDRGFVLLDIGPLDLDKKDWFDLQDAMRILEPKTIVYENPDFSRDPKTILDSQLVKIANLVEHYCQPFLEGDFSLYESIIEARTKWREQTLREMRQKSKG